VSAGVIAESERIVAVKPRYSAQVIER
jgi:hypothetical protein